MTKQATLLIVDDDTANLKSYSMLFARSGYRLLEANGGQKALDILRDEIVDVVLTDLNMPQVDGLQVVAAAGKLPQPPVVLVITAYGTVETAVEAMQSGATDYLTKPVNPTELRLKVENGLELHGLRERNENLEELVHEKFRFEGVIGESASMRTIIDQSRRVAASQASVMIYGESGTGKELVARAIHFNSNREKGPFVPIHCAALPETLIESELFGSEKGAFTGSTSRRIGQFESANGGTVFLDELGEIPLSTQVKLLRVLEQREITRVGASKSIPIDIRLVAATNKNLEEEVQAGRFREDLYYRLNVIHIDIPPLRDRVEDIPLLVQFFLKSIAKDNNRSSDVTISPEALQQLVKAPWPGNIRELRNVLEQMIVFCTGDELSVSDLPAAFRMDIMASVNVSGLQYSDSTEFGGVSDGKDLRLDTVEKRHILEVLEQMQSNRTRAAEILGISRRTLQRKLKELGIRRK